jgi:hypothetical protein
VKQAWIFGIAAVLAGCAPGEAALVGKWKGDVKMSETERQAPLANVATGLASSVTMDVAPDHTFRMTAMVMPIEGTWLMEGRRAVFTPKEVFGFKRSDGPFTLELGPDGRSLTPVDPKQDRNWYFRKEEKP